MAHTGPTGNHILSGFQGHGPVDEVRISDNGATVYMTGDRTRTCDFTPRAIENDQIIRFLMDCFGKLKVVFHEHEDVQTTLLNVACVPALGFI